MFKSELRELYTKIPKSHCAENCFDCCINSVQFTPEEKENMGGYEYDGKCPHLRDGICAVYDDRPFVCRIYGVSEILPCAKCRPEKYLTGDETKALIHDYVTIKHIQENEIIKKQDK